MVLIVLLKDLQIYKVIHYGDNRQSRYRSRFKSSCFYMHHHYINNKLDGRVDDYYWNTLTNITNCAKQHEVDQHNDDIKE